MRDVYSFCNALHLHTEENRHDAQIKLYGVFRKQEVKTLINKIIEEKHSSSVGLTYYHNRRGHFTHCPHIEKLRKIKIEYFETHGKILELFLSYAFITETTVLYKDFQP